jgi:hypothetical protein
MSKSTITQRFVGSVIAFVGGVVLIVEGVLVARTIPLWSTALLAVAGLLRVRSLTAHPSGAALANGANGA